MPLFYLRRLTGRDRTHRANRQLARYLAFVAGAVNAGGFLAVHQYTSHMSGIVSSMADNLVLGHLPFVLAGAGAVLSFLLGAACTSLMVRLAESRALHSKFALPLVVEAALLLAFALNGRIFEIKISHSRGMGGWEIESTILLLCFTMGLQNAMITKISGAVIRTTHMTGMVTDIGIEIGQLLYALISRQKMKSVGEASEGWLLASLVSLFFIGGVVGATGFRHFGFLFSLPFAALLLLLAIVPIVDDLRC